MGGWIYKILFTENPRPLPHTIPYPSRQNAKASMPLELRAIELDQFEIAKKWALELVEKRADIDISGAEFDFVRSIRVFNIQFASQRLVGENDRCGRFASILQGTYGPQGTFSWVVASPKDLPNAHVGLENWGEDCPVVSNRSVFVDWRDSGGIYGFEQVNY